MILFPLMECCQRLAIDPKTLRHWLQQAAMPVHVHPMDGRRKCLTHEQVQQLAVSHDRVLKPDSAPLTADVVETTALPVPPEPALRYTISNTGLLKPAAVLDDEQLRQKLSQLEAQVIAQQQQLILLTRDLLRERATRTQRRFSPLETSDQLQGDAEILGWQHENLASSMHTSQNAVRPLHPAEQRARFLVLPPLIEYSAAGTYVVISSQEGEIPLIAESLEWFEWFRTLSSFRFVGQSGHFGACRGYDRRPLRTWYAHRTIHQHEYRHYLGLSEHLTIAIWSRWRPDSNPTCSRSL